jgi:hypothetical protein
LKGPNTESRRDELLVLKGRNRKRRDSGIEVVRDSTFEAENNSSPDLNVLEQRLFVLPVLVRLKGSNTLGSEEGKVLKLKLNYDRQSVGQCVLVSSAHLGPATNFSSYLKFSLDICEFVIS